MFGLDIRSLGLVLLLAYIPQPSLAKRDLEAEFLSAGFVPGVREPMCTKSLYVADSVKGNLQVRPADATTKVFGRERSLRFAGKSVRYEAEDKGEFGGKLEAVLPSGERRLILEGNVQSLLPLASDLFVFEGLAHMSMTSGSIYRIRNYDRDPKLQSEPVTFLPDTPVFVALQPSRLGGQEFWVVGTHSLVNVRLDVHWLDIVSWNEFDVSEVSSFLFEDRGILIGTCGGVIAIESRCLHSAMRPDGNNSCAARFFVPREVPRASAKAP